MPSPTLIPTNTTLSPMDTTLTILGHVRSALTDRETAPKSGAEGAPEAWLELDAAYAPALLGLEVGQRILVLTWLHQGDRSVLQCHPRADKARPLFEDGMGAIIALLVAASDSFPAQ